MVGLDPPYAALAVRGGLQCFEFVADFQPRQFQLIDLCLHFGFAF